MEKTRNIAVAGHNGTGKTALIETILYNLGLINRIGKLQEGNTVSDYREDEIKRQMSIDSTVVSAGVDGVRINFADLPGYADFSCDAKFAMKAFDCAAIVIDACSGIEVGTETAWEYSEEFGMPRMFFLNMMDKEGADFDAAVSALNDKWGRDVRIVPVQIPIGSEAGFSGVFDLISMKGLFFEDGKASAGDAPPEVLKAAEEAKSVLVEAAAETDDSLVEKFLEGGSLTESEILNGLLEGIRTLKIIPVLCGSVEKNIAVETFVSALVSLMPPPDALAPAEGKDPANPEEKIEIKPGEDEPARAYVFKTSNEAHLGNVTLFRMYSGKISPGAELFNPAKNTSEKLNQIFLMRGKHREEVSEARAGDILATAKLKSTLTSDTLCDKKFPVIIEKPRLPQGVTSTALIPAAKKDQEKLSFALAKLSEEDPGIKVRFDPEFAQTILTGAGDVHLDIIGERLKSRFNVDVNIESPGIAYRETVRSTGKAQGKYKKQSGGRGQYGDAWLQIEPLAGADFEFVNKIVGGSIPTKYIPAVEKGVRDSMSKGDLAGYPILNAKVTVYDGSYHDVDSSDIAFQIAASMAFKKAYQQAKPVLLEPYSELHIAIPGDFVGDVTSDLNSRRGRVMGIESSGDKKIIKAQAPAADIGRYSADLRSMTQGRGSFQMQFSHYEEVPQKIMEKLVSELKEQEE